MQQFINGDDTQFDWLRSQIQESLMIFQDVPLPISCIPNRCRIGFEYTEANGFKLYIDKNIAFTGDHASFAAWLTNGEASFDTYDDMIAFIRGLGGLFESSEQPQSVPDNSRQQQNDQGSSEQPQSDSESTQQSQNDPESSLQPQNDPLSLTYSVTSPLGNRMDFSFKYEKVELPESRSYWRAFIIDCPDYGSRSRDAHATQRVTHSDGRHYVSWCPDPARLDQITAVSKRWAEATAKYIDLGGNFGS
jgi:hypothetical protein